MKTKTKESSTAKTNKQMIEEFIETIDEGCERFHKIMNSDMPENVHEAASDALIDTNLSKNELIKYTEEHGYMEENILIDLVADVNKVYSHSLGVLRSMLDELEPHEALKFNI